MVFLSVTVLRDIVYRDKTFQWKSDIPDAVKETVKADKKFPEIGWFLFWSGGVTLLKNGAWQMMRR